MLAVEHELPGAHQLHEFCWSHRAGAQTLPHLLDDHGMSSAATNTFFMLLALPTGSTWSRCDV